MHGRSKRAKGRVKRVAGVCVALALVQLYNSYTYCKYDSEFVNVNVKYLEK